MTAAAEEFAALMRAHRSIRQYRSTPLDPAWVDEVLVQSLAGSSSSGNLNLVSVIKTFDAMILAQTAALAFESHGLGICYMGTTLFAMREIADFLELPGHCLPVTSLVVGWPDEAPAQRDRLPGRAWLHDERYQRPTAESIDADFGARDRLGWERYRAMGPEIAERMREHGIESLAQYYTSPIKYDPDLFAGFSADLQALLAERGFMP